VRFQWRSIVASGEALEEKTFLVSPRVSQSNDICECMRMYARLSLGHEVSDVTKLDGNDGVCTFEDG